MNIEIGKVGMIDLKSIIVEDRIRAELGDLNSLESNMKESGLISPLAVKDNRNGTYRLLAGGRRFTILERNNVKEVPVRIFENDLSDLEMKVIERAENFYRKDLEFYEFDKITMEIHSMQQVLKGVKFSGPGSSGWSATDTAEMIGAKSPATVTEAIKRAEAREAFPELFDGCKTASDASKVLKKLDEALVKQQIAQKLESQNTDSNIHQLSKRYIVNSFFEGVKEIPDNIMHLVEIDPPYAINLINMKKKDGESQYILKEYSEIPSEFYMDGSPDGAWRGMNTVFRECYRVMTQHSWLVCWFAPEPWFEEMYKAINKAGFSTTRMVGIWTGKGPGQNMNPSTRLANSYEMFFYAWKGSPALNKAGHGNEFNCPPIPAQQKTHPTERPIELMKEIYDTFAFSGSRVFIPFLGSGNGIISANQLGMSAVGFDLSKAHKDSFLVKAHLMTGGSI
jgi:ParB/RepB/Spo0J family partition protein